MAFTFFFRDRQTLDLIQELVVPIMRTRRYIHIWDAGCANGSEPYSLAILIREKMGQFLFRNVNIIASDLNNNFEKIIKDGIYSKDEIGRIPENILKTYFLPTKIKPDSYILSEEIKKSVKFIHHDLLSFFPPRIGFCLIMCKNVLLHFNQNEQINVIKMFHDALEHDGYFVTEQTQRLPDVFNSKFERVVNNAQLFKKI